MVFNDNFIFTDDSSVLKAMFENATTLEKMGLKVKTGQVVWNEVKEELSVDTENTILVYNSNITKDN